MAIFDKKTNKPIDSDELARRVEEYNRQFTANAEPQPKTEFVQPAPSSKVAQPTQEKQKGSNIVEIAGIEEGVVDAAKTLLVELVFGPLKDGQEKQILLMNFNNREPSKTILTAAAQFFKITASLVASDDYTPSQANADLEVLKKYVASKKSEQVPLIALLLEFPQYAMTSSASFLTHKKGMSTEAAMMTVIEKVDPTITKLNDFIQSIMDSDEDEVPNSGYSSTSSEDNLQDIPDNIVASTKNGLTKFVFEIMKDGAAKEIIRAGFKGKEPSKEMLTAAAQCFKMVMFRITEPTYDRTILQRDMDRLLTYIGRQTVSPPLILMLSEYPDYAMGSGLSYMMNQRGVSVEEAKSYLETELLPVFEQLSEYIHNLRAKARLL